MVAMSFGIAHGMRAPSWQIGIGWKALLRQPAREGHRDNSHQKIAFRQRRRTHAPVNRMMSRGAGSQSPVEEKASELSFWRNCGRGEFFRRRRRLRRRCTEQRPETDALPCRAGRKLRMGPQPSLLRAWSFARVRNRRALGLVARPLRWGAGDVSHIRCGSLFPRTLSTPFTTFSCRNCQRVGGTTRPVSSSARPHLVGRSAAASSARQT
jgi:hypothetical protein